jgi:hypothetical protein
MDKILHTMLFELNANARKKRALKLTKIDGKRESEEGNVDTAS